MKPQNYLNELKRATESLDLEELKSITDIFFETYKKGKDFYIVGNGGSASTASHFACDLGKGTLENYNNNQRRFRVQSLTDNVAVMTAYGNDLNYNEIFSQQLKNLIRSEDILIAISASGNSPNIVKAVEIANEYKALSIGLLGFGGGKLKDMVTNKIIIDSHDYGIVEDLHLSIVHMISQSLKERIRGIY
jgi:D-sedoheptulose 7-phosphate isomerase